MAINFKLKDVLHRVVVKFLPDTKKPFILAVMYQPEVDIHGIASKAAVYNITTPPKVIEEGLTAGFELMCYLAADGYKIVTPIFMFKIRLPGEYDGWETHLAEGLHPEGRITITPQFRKYIAENVQIQFDGIDDDSGIIGEVINRVNGDKNETVRPNALFEVHGLGLKITSDADHANDTGLYFESLTDGSRVRVDPANMGINEPKKLMAITPGEADLPIGTLWYVVIRTQSFVKSSIGIQKSVREVKSDFIITSA
jgi:hypothetical protein